MTSQKIYMSAGIAALFLITFAAYLTLYNAGFIWDDPDYVINNTTLRDFNGLWRMWFEPESIPQFYPLVHTSFWIEYQIWQLNPLGYHISNIVIHCLGAVCIWYVLAKLGFKGAWFAALIFAVHPVQVESVAWITERKNVLSLLFYFLSLGFYLNFLGIPLETTRNRMRHYWWAFFFFICALFSKTVTCSLPAAILVILWWKNGQISKEQLYRVIPFFVAGLASALITVGQEITLVGATGDLFNWTFFERVLIAGRVIWFYLGKLLWPADLAFFYPQWPIDSSDFFQWLYPAGVVTAMCVLWLLRERIGRTPVAVALLFCGTLVPALGFINVYPMKYSFVADHFQYLATIFPIAFFTAAIYEAVPDRRLKYGLFSIIVTVCGWLTYQQAKIYKNEETLWLATLETNPRAWMAANNLGSYYGKQNDYERAGKYIRLSLEINPDNINAKHNLALLYKSLNQPENAESIYLEILARQPDDPAVNFRLAESYRSRGLLPQSIGYFQAAIMHSEKPVAPHVNLAIVYEALGERQAAKFHFEKALESSPGLQIAIDGIGRTRSQNEN